MKKTHIKSYQNTSWYSIILSVLMIGFLMILTTGVFNLVLRELKDNKWEQNYLEASQAAIWSSELALLQIKEKGYWYQDKIEDSINDRSVVLSSNPTDSTKFHILKDVNISYDLDYTVDSYEWLLKPTWYDIIPLFFTWASIWDKVRDLELTVNSGNESLLSWNIIGKDNWISWVWEFDKSTKWKWRSLTNYEFQETEIWTFLVSSENNYLILVNLDPNNNISYRLTSPIDWEFFTKPRTKIKSSATIWGYRQNLEISFDNTEFLKMLRYSIYWN